MGQGRVTPWVPQEHVGTVAWPGLQGRLPGEAGDRSGSQPGSEREQPSEVEKAVGIERRESTLNFRNCKHFLTILTCER